ncbi:hypothetical protein BKP35_12915 [Anaerobacillus arseniciselenatis]|uniref:Uncharacterized protein n=1 Tax=Anaerobacillus arseniciselenatis TaxID=85682 RepID=A0A1S2LFG7_9BACI|nr:hypothetical protein [Anaerobacillus arseniciselenatis]OIJ10980.1 hypothetical protein BKP35_12915 [Anaerobacillus arseniciselenatis]
MKKYIILLMMMFFTVGTHSVYSDSAETLQNKYLPLFEEIEQKAVNELNFLIDEAYIEYERKKEKGELTVPILFAYIEKGKQLEEEIDKDFQTILAHMKREITEKGLPETLAAPFEKQYLKSKRKNKLHILKNITLEGHTISFER